MIQFSSVQFSCSVVSDSLRPHESQHARPPCPSPTPLNCLPPTKYHIQTSEYLKMVLFSIKVFSLKNVNIQISHPASGWEKLQQQSCSRNGCFHVEQDVLEWNWQLIPGFQVEFQRHEADIVIVTLSHSGHPGEKLAWQYVPCDSAWL